LQLNDNNFYLFFNYIPIIKYNLLSSVVNIAPDENRSVFLHLLISVFVGTSEENSSFRVRRAVAADMKQREFSEKLVRYCIVKFVELLSRLGEHCYGKRAF